MRFPLSLIDLFYFSLAILLFLIMENVNNSGNASSTYFWNNSLFMQPYANETMFFCFHCEISYSIEQFKKCGKKFHHCFELYCYRCQTFHLDKCKFPRRPFEVLESRPEEFFK